MKKWEFPNQKCAIAGCKKNRKHLVILQGAAINLCSTHMSTIEDGTVLDMKDFSMDDIMRVIHED
jgi:hypothetical protein